MVDGHSDSAAMDIEDIEESGELPSIDTIEGYETDEESVIYDAENPLAYIEADRSTACNVGDCI